MVKHDEKSDSITVLSEEEKRIKAIRNPRKVPDKL